MKSPARPRKPTSTVPKPRPADMRSAVLLSLIVCPQGGVARRRHGQGARGADPR